MNQVVRVLSKIPNTLFLNAKLEVSNIDWNNLPIRDQRSDTSVFKTSITSHLRIHKKTMNTPHTIEALSAIVDCMDTSSRRLYPEVDKLVSWIYNHVEGTKLGRIMLVKLLPSGIIGKHIDPGQYFQEHYRFHVPLITNPNVLFYGEDNIPIHMPEGFLSQLANRRWHSAENKSNVDRIHLIVDIDSNNPIYNI
jgi:hypothetical protein